MEYALRFAHLFLLWVLGPVLLAALIFKLRYYKGVRYRYPLSTLLFRQALTSRHPRTTMLFVLRLLTLGVLTILLLKPQLVDHYSKVTVNGIDIVLVMDVSGSMQVPHHEGDNRSRFEVAQDEAIRFVNKRTNDAMGLVIFGNDAVSRCPVTMDKNVLKSLIQDLHLGVIDASGTLLATGILTAANRLKHSKARSKVMVVLTDGEPSPDDVDPLVAIAVAQELGIKIYTIGIGDNQVVLMPHPLFGLQPQMTTLNKPLLEKFAKETGGLFFEAKQPDDIRRIYETIDTLEKNEIEAPIFSRVYDWFIPLVWIVCFLVLCELMISTIIWFGV